MTRIFLIILSLFIGSLSNARTTDFMSEASGVCRLGDILVIAGDEDSNSLWTLKDGSSTPTRVTLSGVTWDDVEDLARIDDNSFFAVTSHSRTKKANRHPEREQLMWIANSAGGFRVQQSWNLRDAILAALESQIGGDIDFKIVKSASPDDGGLNIEGLGYFSGHLYIGLRAPITNQGEALMLVMDDAILRGGPPVIQNVVRLPLGLRGIRGLSADAGGLTILNGPTANEKQTFSVDRWRAADGALTHLNVPGLSALEKPEGVLVEADGSLTFVQDFVKPRAQDVVVDLNIAP